MARNSIRPTEAPNPMVRQEAMSGSKSIGMVPLPGKSPMMDAPNQSINVALEPTDARCGCTPGNCSCGPDCGCMCCYGNGPGGKTTIIQYNERGILQEGLFHIISMGTQASMRPDHDSFSQGIYAHPPTPYGLDD